MSKINRDYYLQQLINHQGDGMVKVVTGMRRSGKSYLLFHLFVEWLENKGVDSAHLLKLNLEDRRHSRLCDPDNLLAYIDNRIRDNRQYYILLDEVQNVRDFESVLNSYLDMPNVDVYVTGSNAHLLSKDVITEFRGRGWEIQVRPLSFTEYRQVRPQESDRMALNNYMLYGGLPYAVLLEDESNRKDYLKRLFSQTYLRDIKQRYAIRLDDDLEELIDILSSSIGSMTNPKKLSDTFHSVKQSKIAPDTIKLYLDYLQDAFLIDKATRYDIKGKRYIDTPHKYYFQDLGLRNARINFRQSEPTHLLENLIYNELCRQGFSVDVGQISTEIIHSGGKRSTGMVEVDFVCNRGYDRVYIQSAWQLADVDKMQQELRSLKLIKDNFPKVIISADSLQPTYRNDDGILILNIFDFLSEKVKL